MLSRVPCWTNPFWSYHPDTDPVAAQNWKQSLLSDEHFVFFRIRFFSPLVSSIFCWVSLVWASDLNSIFFVAAVAFESSTQQRFLYGITFLPLSDILKARISDRNKNHSRQFFAGRKKCHLLGAEWSSLSVQVPPDNTCCFLAWDETDSMKCTLKYFTNTFKLSRYDLYVFFGNWVCFSVSAPSCKYLLGTEVPETFFWVRSWLFVFRYRLFLVSSFFLFCCSTWVAMRRWSQKRAGNVLN